MVIQPSPLKQRINSGGNYLDNELSLAIPSHRSETLHSSILPELITTSNTQYSSNASTSKGLNLKVNHPASTSPFSSFDSQLPHVHSFDREIIEVVHFDVHQEDDLDRDTSESSPSNPTVAMAVDTSEYDTTSHPSLIDVGHLVHKVCAKESLNWFADQKLPFDSTYAPTLGATSEHPDLPPSLPTSFLEKSREERIRQYNFAIDIAFEDMRIHDRSRVLVRLLTSPEYLSDGNVEFDFDQKFDDFKRVVVRAASQAVSKAETIAYAAEAAKDFVPSVDTLLSDSISIARNGGRLSELIRVKRAFMQKDGFCEESVVKTLGPEHPDVAKIVNLINDGARLEPGPDFVLINQPPPARNIEKVLDKAMLKEYCKLQSEGKGLLVDRRVLHPEESARLSFVANHLTKKLKSDGSVDPNGRWCIDASNTANGEVPLNNDFTRANAIIRFGELFITPFPHMIRGIIDFCELHGLNASDMRIGKLDVQCAFNKFNYDFESSCLMCNRITRDLFYFPLVGNFGTSTAPFVFDCIMRAIDDVLRRRSLRSTLVGKNTSKMPPLIPIPETPVFTRGFTGRLTDDIIEFSPSGEAEQYHLMVKEVLDSAFGPGKGWNRKKDEPPESVKIVD